MINTPLQLDEWYKGKTSEKNFYVYHMEAVHREVIQKLKIYRSCIQI